MKSFRWFFLGFLAFIGLLFMRSSSLEAQGVLVLEPHPNQRWSFPRHNRPPVLPAPEVPLLYRVKSLEIEGRIKNSVVRVQMSQVFVNEGSQVVEARCLIPVPYDAAVNNVTFMVDGKEIEGKMFPIEQARSIYQGYVRQSKDPALVQWMGSGLIQTSVFPIPPGKERTVSIGYSLVLPKNHGMMEWNVPLKAAGFTSQPIEKVSISAYVEDTAKLGNIYSPTHSIDIHRSGDRSATAKIESKSNIPMNDFRLMVATSSNELTANWFGHQPVGHEPGYFMMLLHPDFDVPKESAPKNVVLVLDKSGSMRGEKIEQARQALLYVLKNLPKKDHFGIVVYDSQVQSFRDSLSNAGDEGAMESAKSFVNSISASGGTNLNQGLEVALKLAGQDDRPTYVVHLSDGVPTIGLTDERQIAANVVRLNSNRSRVFNFGVGHDVNSKLMNRLSNECFGQTFFVAPEENIEASVSTLYDRLGQPALSNVRWELNFADKANASISMAYPTKIHDIFSGEQISILGRFQGGGKATLVITGKLGEKEMRYEQVIDLDEGKSQWDNAFVAPLWASRRAAGIIDEIDLEGRKESLISELIELAKKHGILTEYTAFLAEEPSARPMASAPQEVDRRLSLLQSESGKDAFRQRKQNSIAGNAKNLQAMDVAASQGGFAESSAGAVAGAPGPATRPGLGLPGAGSGTGRSGGLGIFGGGYGGGGPLPARASEGATPVANVRRVGDRAFFMRNGKWIDAKVGDEVPKTAKKIERFSDEYFQLMKKYDGLLNPLADIEEEIVVELDGTVYVL